MNSRIKLSAREAMCGSYMKIIPLTAAIFLVVSAFSVCNAVVNYYSANRILLAVFSVATLILFVVLVAPLRLILQIKFLVFAKGKNKFMKPETGFFDFLKACELSIKLFFIKGFWLLAFEILPLVCGIVFAGYCSRNAVSLRGANTIISGIVVLAVSGLIFYFLFTQRYSKSWFFLACYRDFTASDAIKESIRKTQGKLAETLFFKLGFAPWFLLCAAVLPAFFVIPYYKQSVTCFYLSR